MKIGVIGSLNYDIIIKQTRLPKLGETFFADNVFFAGGGKGANQAIQLAKLGVETTMYGAVGKDFYGQHMINSLNEYGVSTKKIKIFEKATTGLGFVNSFKDGGVTATVAPGANYLIKKSDIENDIFQENQAIVLQLEIPQDVVDYCIEKAEKNNIQIFLNGAPARKIEDEVLKKVDYFIVNEVEAGQFLDLEIKSIEDAKSAIKKFDKLIKKGTIITLGEKGSVISDKNSVWHISPLKVKAIETTGAGDSYIGGFVYKILSGNSFKESCEFASLVSAITVTKIGGQDSMPFLKEIESF